MSAPSQLNASQPTSTSSSQTVQSGTKKSSAQDESGRQTAGTEQPRAQDAKSSPCSFEAAVNKLYELWRKNSGLMNPGSKAGLCKQFLAHGCAPEMFEAAYTYAKSEQSKAQGAAAPTNGTGAPTSLSSTQRNAREAQGYANRLAQYITEKKGKYLADELGDFSVVLEGNRIALNFETDNRELNALLLKVCSITLHDYLAKLTVERVIQVAYAAAGKFRLRKFSAMSKDQQRLYIPLKDSSKVLKITADKIEVVDNGTNEDNLWLEHPTGDISDGDALNYKEADPAEGLREFERLVVDSMAVREPGMYWFLAIQETHFPFVRDVNNDRFVPDHDGPQGSGKTTAAMGSACTLGLNATGDTTPAALNRLGDCGLLVMDNKESANFTLGFNGYVVYLSTGALSLRAQGEGYTVRNQSRPVGVITSIEGPVKPETIDRTVRVSFNAHERNRSKFDKDAHLREIRQKRNLMVSALVHVLRRFMELKQQGHEIEVPEAIDRFSGNYRTDVLLLKAYADTAEKPDSWVELQLKNWKAGMQTREDDNEQGNEFSHFVEQFQRALNVAYEMTDVSVATTSPTKNVDDLLRPIIDRAATTIEYKGQKGALTRFTASELLEWLKKKNPFNKTLANMIPNTLGNRLRGIKLEDDAQILTENELPELLGKKRDRPGAKQQRFLGLFEPSDQEQPAVPAKPAPSAQKQIGGNPKPTARTA